MKKQNAVAENLSVSNYFEKLGLPTSYNINLSLLEERFLALQQTYHPDKHIAKSESEKRNALNSSLELNEAYNTLKSDFKRAEYLMKLKGLDTSDEHLKNVVSKTILLEGFEEREKLDSLSSDEEIAKMLNDTKITLENLSNKFQQHYQNNDFKEALDVFLKIRYKSKLLEELNAKQYELAY